MNMGIVRDYRRTTTNANEVTRGSRLVLMSKYISKRIRAQGGDGVREKMGG